MRLIYNITMIALTALTVAACAGKKESATTGTTHEELTFPVGERIESAAFTGEAFQRPMIQTDTVFNFPTTNTVTFAPGALSGWHRHGGMVVLVTDGIGYHQIEGLPVEVMHPGDVAMCPPGVKHWHGATPGSRFAHIAANSNPDRPGVEWFDLLTKEEYDNLPKE